MWMAFKYVGCQTESRRPQHIKIVNYGKQFVISAYLDEQTGVSTTHRHDTPDTRHLFGLLLTEKVLFGLPEANGFIYF